MSTKVKEQSKTSWIEESSHGFMNEKERKGNELQINR